MLGISLIHVGCFLNKAQLTEPMASFRASSGFSKRDKKHKKHVFRGVKKTSSRKEKRKIERAAKKKRNAVYFSRKKDPVLLDTTDHDTVELQQKKLKKKVSQVAASNPDDEHKRKQYLKSADVSMKSALLAANNKEDKEIARLEKLLKMKKKKNLPTSFSKEGLDYLLDLSTKDSSEWNLSEEEDDDDMPTHDMVHDQSSSEPEETVTVVSRSRKAVKRSDYSSKRATGGDVGVLQSASLVQKKGIIKTNTRLSEKLTPSSKRVRFSSEGLNTVNRNSDSSSDETDQDLLAQDYRNEEEMDSLNDDSDSDNEADYFDEDGMSFEHSDGYESTGSSDESLVDSGDEIEGDENISNGTIPSTSSKYVPPHLRTDGKNSRNLERLKKRVQGLVNRLSESNMKSISSELEQLYLQNSRNDMNTTLTEVLMKACVTPMLLADRFALEHMMLVAILHSNVGPEIGAHMVQTLAVKLDELLKDGQNYGKGKECDCVVLLLAHLYNYRVVHCLLIYDVIHKLVESFSERDVELLLLLLKNTGMEIRKDDASSLKDIILQIQSKAASSSFTESSRMHFMLDTISALRTNNVRKIPNYDPSLLEHMKKHLRGSVRTTGSLDEGQLKISLSDLLNADKCGRWWIVGSAWTCRDTNTASETDRTSIVPTADSWVLELARKQRMNTDLRKNIFCILMTSEDYADAFEKLLKLSLKEVQEREVVHVLVDCCLQERTYNQYYAFLAQKLCEFKRSHQVTFQYALWDRFKSLDTLSAANRSNLSKLTAHLISTKALSLAVLRVADFGMLDKVGVRFYKVLLSSLLLDNSEEVVCSLFSRVAPLPHLKALRDELLVFMKHFLNTSGSTAPESSSVDINERIRVAERAMRTEGHLF